MSVGLRCLFNQEVMVRQRSSQALVVWYGVDREAHAIPMMCLTSAGGQKTEE